MSSTQTVLNIHNNHIKDKNMAKAAYLKEYRATIKRWIAEKYMEPGGRTLLAREFLRYVNEQLQDKAKRSVSLSYVNTYLAELRRKDRAGELIFSEDWAFSIGACSRPEYVQYFPPCYISKLVKFRKRHEDESCSTEEEKSSFAEDEKEQTQKDEAGPFLTLRLAKWFVRVLPAVEELFTDEAVNSYRSRMIELAIGDGPERAREWEAIIGQEPRDNIVCDYAFAIGNIYAEREKISEILGESILDSFDTHDLDTAYFGSGTFDVDKFDDLERRQWKRILDNQEQLEARKMNGRTGKR
jgi:hypothetical protein